LFEFPETTAAFCVSPASSSHPVQIQEAMISVTLFTLLACVAQIHAEEVHVATNDIDNFVGNLVDNTDNLYAETDENGDDSLDSEEEEDSDETEDEEEELAESMADELADKLVDRVLKTSFLPKADMETTTLAKNNEAQIRRRLNDELEDDKTLADYSDEELESMLHRAGGGSSSDVEAAPARKLIVKAMKAMKVMKAVTVMKAMKAMKAIKQKKKRVSKIAKGRMAKSLVFSGARVKTSGGLTKADLIRNKNGKIVSKKQQAAGKKAYNNIKAWATAVSKARKSLSLKGFVPIKKGTPLYTKTKSFYR